MNRISSTAIPREINAISEQTINTVNAGDETHLLALHGVRHADETKNRQSTGAIVLVLHTEIIRYTVGEELFPLLYPSSSDPKIKIRLHKTI